MQYLRAVMLSVVVPLSLGCVGDPDTLVADASANGNDGSGGNNDGSPGQPDSAAGNPDSGGCPAALDVQDDGAIGGAVTLPDLVISEINPGDYIEVYNTTDAAIDMAMAPLRQLPVVLTISICDASASGDDTGQELCDVRLAGHVQQCRRRRR